MRLIINMFRILARVFLVIVSLCAGILGAHGVYAYLFRSEVLIGDNSDKLFLAMHIPNAAVSQVIEKITLQSISSIILSIILVGIGIITWVTQLSIAKKSLYRRVRFSRPTQASPLAWVMIVAGVMATGYVIANWSSMDHTVAVLVIMANMIAILWNLSVTGH